MKNFSLAFFAFVSSLMADQMAIDSKSPAPEVGENLPQQHSIFKKLFKWEKRGKNGESWWETMEANKERKAFTPVKPVTPSSEGVGIENDGISGDEGVEKEPKSKSLFSSEDSLQTKRSAMPRAFVAVKAGAMDPELSQWDRFYDDSTMKNLGVELGYHLRWGISLLARAQGMSASGKGLLTSTNALGSEVDYRLFPIQAGLQWEFAFTPRDLVRPFLAGGYVHAIYEQDVSDGRKVKGNEKGHWAKGGLLVDLSRFDEQAIRKGQELFERVDLVLEVERLWLKSDAIGEDLGGLNLGFGFRVGF